MTHLSRKKANTRQTKIVMAIFALAERLPTCWQWCTFFQAGVLFIIEKAYYCPIFAILTHALFGVLFSGLNNAMVYQNWQISVMISIWPYKVLSGSKWISQSQEIRDSPCVPLINASPLRSKADLLPAAEHNLCTTSARQLSTNRVSWLSLCSFISKLKNGNKS